MRFLNTPFVSASAGAPFGPEVLPTRRMPTTARSTASAIAGNSFSSAPGAAGLRSPSTRRRRGACPRRPACMDRRRWDYAVRGVRTRRHCTRHDRSGRTRSTGTFSGTTGEDRFFGITNAAGISAIRISHNRRGQIEIDHLQYGVSAAPHRRRRHRRRTFRCSDRLVWVCSRCCWACGHRAAAQALKTRCAHARYHPTRVRDAGQARPRQRDATSRLAQAVMLHHHRPDATGSAPVAHLDRHRPSKPAVTGSSPVGAPEAVVLRWL